MFYENFIKLCAQKGESPNAVANKLGLSTGTVTWWKKGRIPRNPLLYKLADYFGVTVEYLLRDNQSENADNKKTPSGEPDGVVLDPNRQILQDLMSKLSPAKQKQGIEYIEFLVEQEEKEKKP